MPRPPNEDLRTRVLEYIKLECFKTGGMISPSLSDIATAIGEPNTHAETISRIIERLEKGGYIKVHKGLGSQANRYEFIRDEAAQLVSTSKNRTKANINVLTANMNNSMKALIEFSTAQAERSHELSGELQYLQKAILQLEEHGTLADGSLLYRVPKSSSIPLLLGKLRMEEPKPEEQE